MEKELVIAEEKYNFALEKLKKFGIEIDSLAKVSFGKEFKDGPYVRFEGGFYYKEIIAEKSGEIIDFTSTKDIEELIFELISDVTWDKCYLSGVTLEEAFSKHLMLLKMVGFNEKYIEKLKKTYHY